MIKVVKRFSYNQIVVPGGLSALASGLYTCIKSCNFLFFYLAIFHQISHGLSNKWFCQFD